MLLPRNLVDQVAGVQEIGGGCTGQMVACLLLEKVGSPQPPSLIGTPKESFFVEQFFSPRQIKAPWSILVQVVQRAPASKTKEDLIRLHRSCHNRKRDEELDFYKEQVIED